MSNVIDRGRNPLFGRVCFFQIATQSLSLTFAAGLVTPHHSLAAVDGCALSKELMNVVASVGGLLHSKVIDRETI
jgi:hypothetical protein